MASTWTKAFVAKTHTIFYGISQRLIAFERGDSPAKACNATASSCASNPPRLHPTSARVTQRLISMKYLLLILFFIAPISKAGQCLPDGTYYDFDGSTPAGVIGMCSDAECEQLKAQRLKQGQDECYRRALLEQQQRQNDLLEQQQQQQRWQQISPPTTTTNCYRNYDGSITCTTQ